MGPDLVAVYRRMLRSRRFEEAVKALWEAGKISGEMHLGIGEEAIVAGLLCHIRDGDAMALDHRCTPPLVMRGVDLVAILREVLGKHDGLCGGMGGHMHLFSRDHLAATSGIVGASGPLCAGFALAAQYRHSDNLAIALFGEGAFNQGMLMESMNLAAAWKLPAIFVCKDNGWAITTVSARVTGGSIAERARGLGVPVVEVDGTDVEAVWQASSLAVDRARNGDGPTFILACCLRLEGHYLGDPLLRAKMTELTPQLLRSLAAQGGAPLNERMSSAGSLLSMMGHIYGQKLARRDPLARARRKLGAQKAALDEIEAEVSREVRTAVEKALA